MLANPSRGPPVLLHQQNKVSGTRDSKASLCQPTGPKLNGPSHEPSTCHAASYCVVRLTANRGGFGVLWPQVRGLPPAAVVLRHAG